MKAPKGLRQDTRRKLSKHPRDKGKVPISKYLQTFEVGEYVGEDIEPSKHEGMPHPKFQGKTGLVIGKQGDCFVLLNRDEKRLKKILAHPVHLKRVSEKKIEKSKLEKLLYQYNSQRDKSKKANALLKLYKQLHVKGRKLRMFKIE